jgi:ribonuclease Y
MSPLILAAIGLLVGSAGGYAFKTKAITAKRDQSLEDSRKILKDAELKASSLVMDAKEQALKVQEDLQNQQRAKRQELNKAEQRLLSKEDDLEKKIELAEKKSEEYESKLEKANDLKKRAEVAFSKQEVELERIASMSKEEAKDKLFKKVEEENQDELLKHIKNIEDQATLEAEQKSKMIIALAMQKYAAETASESTATLVQIPGDEMKGRIIGREGRNISAFEKSTGVDVIVDETPETVIISGFDLLRRYIAKVSLERLIADGRIHPARIEEVVVKVREEVGDLIKGLGEKAAYETGVVGLPLEVIKLLGRLKFRTENGQNLLKHSIEVASLAGVLAAELGADVNMVKKAALLHDIGKAVDHEVGGNSAQIGSDICKKFGLPDKIADIIASIGSPGDKDSVEALVVQVASLIAENRVGLDQDNLESYIKRMTDMENIAKSFDGVEKVFAVHTGSEVRVIVDSDQVDDLGAFKLARKIADKIQTDMGHAGKVKVNVVRETRIEEFAE